MNTARELAHQIRTGARTAREVIEATLEAIQASDLNAFTFVDAEGARRMATEVDDLLAGGEEPGPLCGVPVGVKDLIDQAGLPTTCGSSFHRVIPGSSAHVVEALEAAGAVPVGRTGLHEFAYGFSSENPWWGPVLNPWNRSGSPGGSSGGSAAAVAGGLVPLALGTDTGGSVRVPAALCGVGGLKVTHGAISLSGVFPLAPSLDTVGPLGRSVADLETAYGIMAGPDPHDPWSHASPPQPDEWIGPIRIGIPQPWVSAAPIAADVREAFGWAVDRLSDLGMEVIALSAPTIDPPGEAASILGGEVQTVHHRWFPERRSDYGRDVAERLDAAWEVTLDDYVAARAWREGLRQATRRAFASVDALLTPATAVTTKLIGEDHIEVDGRIHHYRDLLSVFSYLVNQMGTPALVLPLGVAGEPPPAIQLIGPWWSERSLLALGRTLEESEVVLYRRPKR